MVGAELVVFPDRFVVYHNQMPRLCSRSLAVGGVAIAVAQLRIALQIHQLSVINSPQTVCFSSCSSTSYGG